MAFAITVAGVAQSIKAGSLHISQTANGRTSASFVLENIPGTSRPALGAEVLMTDGGTRIFGGLVDKAGERGIFAGARTAIHTTVNAVDFNAYAERRFVNETFAAGTLKSMLTTYVANYLTVHGVTLDAGQVNGPTFPELTYTYTKGTNVLNEWATLTAKYGEQYVWRIDAFKVLRMVQPSTEAAPFNIASDTPAEVVDDVTVEPNKEHYANKVILIVPPKTELQHVETFTGDGSTTVFPLQFSVIQAWVVVVDGVFETITLDPAFAGSAYWTYDPVANTITREAGAPANTSVISMTFDGSFEGTATATDASWATDPVEKVVTVDSVPSDTTAQALADAYLAEALPVTQVVKYRTFTAGFKSGQTQAITLPRRNLSGTAVITDVVTRDFGKISLLREITAEISAATNLGGRGWRDVYKIWAGDKLGGSTVPAVGAGAPSASAGGPGAPDKSVQYNRSGIFGGDAAFLYHEEQNSVQCGGGGTAITATDFESCQAFGDNCQIID